MTRHTSNRHGTTHHTGRTATTREHSPQIDTAHSSDSTGVTTGPRVSG